MVVCLVVVTARGSVWADCYRQVDGQIDIDRIGRCRRRRLPPLCCLWDFLGPKDGARAKEHLPRDLPLALHIVLVACAAVRAYSRLMS